MGKFKVGDIVRYDGSKFTSLYKELFVIEKINSIGSFKLKGYISNYVFKELNDFSRVTSVTDLTRSLKEVTNEFTKFSGSTTLLGWYPNYDPKGRLLCPDPNWITLNPITIGGVTYYCIKKDWKISVYSKQTNYLSDNNPLFVIDITPDYITGAQGYLVNKLKYGIEELILRGCNNADLMIVLSPMIFDLIIKELSNSISISSGALISRRSTFLGVELIGDHFNDEIVIYDKLKSQRDPDYKIFIGYK